MNSHEICISKINKSMEQKKRTYTKKKSPEPEREWEFEYGKNPPTMDDMVRYVRYIFE